MSVVVEGRQGQRAFSRPSGALRPGWLLLAAVALAAAVATSFLADHDPAPPLGEADVEAAVLRLSVGTERLIAVLRAGDESGVDAGRARLLEDIDAVAGELRAPPEAPPAWHAAAGPDPAAKYRGRAYALAAVDYARDGARSGDVRQLERATALLRLAERSLVGPGTSDPSLDRPPARARFPLSRAGGGRSGPPVA
jgi:hypothetical protein